MPVLSLKLINGLSFTSIDEWSDYYSAIASVFTTFISLFALILGYIYYEHRILYEQKISKKERIRQRLSLILIELDKCDNYVSKILDMDIEREDLNIIRSKISRSFETITALIDYNDKLLSLNDEEITKILRVDSFVDKSDIIMRYYYRELKDNPDKVMKEREDYLEILINAKRTCFEKME